MTSTKLMTLFPLSLPLSGCTVEAGSMAMILLLVLLPAALVFLLLWALRRQRQGRTAGDDKRNYPDFDNRGDDKD